MSLNEGNQWNVSDGDISSWNWRALDERQASTAGLAPPLSPSHPFLTGHGAAQQAATTQEAIKALICLRARKRSAGLGRRGRKGRGRRRRSPTAVGWWYLFVSRNGPELAAVPRHTMLLQTPNLYINKGNRWSCETKHSEQHLGSRPDGILLSRSWHQARAALQHQLCCCQAVIWAASQEGPGAAAAGSLELGKSSMHF